MEELVELLRCKVGSFLTTYIGLPLEAPYKSSKVWERVEEHFQKRFALWKRQYLPKRGKQTLIKSTLSSLLIYTMSLFVIPKRVETTLEKIQRNFLWGKGILVNKPYRVNWSIVYLDKQKRGLGFKNLSTFNKALLGK